MNQKLVLFLSMAILLSSSMSAQLQVRQNGSIKIGNGNGWPDGGVLQATNDNALTEIRAFAVGAQNARLWAMNTVYSYGFGISSAGTGYICRDVQNPTYLMSFNSSGYIGVNYTPSSTYRFAVGGTTYCTSGYWTASDKSFKREIKPIENSSQNILKLNGMSYYFVDELYTDSVKDGSYNKLHYGFIADEVFEVFPELVMIDPIDNKMALNYDGFIPLLVESYKEQNERINKLEENLNNLALLLTGINDSNKTSKAILEQNSPNPFSNKTIIKFNIVEPYENAALYIYDMQGSEVYRINIERNVNSITLDANSLNAGMYMYTLVVDNEVCDTKRLIVTK